MCCCGIEWTFKINRDPSHRQGDRFCIVIRPSSIEHIYVLSRFMKSPAVVLLKRAWGWILRLSEYLRFSRFFVKSILAVNPSGMRDMETGVPPLKPAGPGVSFFINIDFEWI